MLAADEPVARPDVVPNIRDLGGLLTESGRRTRPGVLVRSAEPQPGDRAPTGLPSWPPTEVIDLRSAAELRGRAHPLAGPGTRVHALPLISGHHSGRAFDWSRVPDLPTAYPRLMAGGAAKLVAVLRLAAHARGPVLVHCAAGKDRTGIAVAVLLRAAGVTRDAVLADYVHTAQHTDQVFARDIVFQGPQDPTHRLRLMGAPAEAIAAVIDELDRAGAGAADPPGAWLLRHGATAAELTAWRGRIVGAGDTG